MAYSKDAFIMPALLTGLPGEVSGVVHWPLSDAQLVRLARGKGHEGATDCIVHFDRIKAGGKYNARRVHYNGRFFVRYHRGVGGVVPIGGALAFRVLDVVTRVYMCDDVEREIEAFSVYK